MNALLIIMVVTVYVPAAGEINGGPLAANGTILRTGHAACGPGRLPGTVFEVDGWPEPVTCVDRGGAIGHYDLDLALVGDDVEVDLARAFAWGRRRRQVRVWPSMAHRSQYARKFAELR